MNRNTLLRSLKKHNIAKAVVNYSGCGDEGNLQEAIFLNSRGKPITRPKKMSEKAKGEYLEIDRLKRDIDSYCSNILEDKEGGWENGDGASGEFIIDVAKNKITHTHNEYFTDSTTRETEY